MGHEEQKTIANMAESATVEYFKRERVYEKLLHIMQRPIGDDEQPLGREGEALYLMSEMCKQSWMDGFTARLSGEKGD